MAKQRGGGRWDGGRLLSLTFDSHLAPSAAKKFSVHTALCIAIETFLLITTETSFPAPDKESSLPVETALHQPFPKPTSFFRSQPTSSSPPFFSFFTPPLFISTFPTFSSPLAQLPFYRSFFFISPFLFFTPFFPSFFFALFGWGYFIQFNSTSVGFKDLFLETPTTPTVMQTRTCRYMCYLSKVASGSYVLLRLQYVSRAPSLSVPRLQQPMSSYGSNCVPLSSSS